MHLKKYFKKLHALLCREYIKGRDWYDFTWYVTRKTLVNFKLLNNALQQQGPWVNQSLSIDKPWLIENLNKKVASIDWTEAKKDVSPFIKPRDQHSVNLWNENLFWHFIKTLQEYLP